MELINEAARTPSMELMSGTHTLSTRFNEAARTPLIELMPAWNSHTELISAAARTAPMEHMSGTHTLNTRFNAAARTTSIELVYQSHILLEQRPTLSSFYVSKSTESTICVQCVSLTPRILSVFSV
jgi:hypothetical protein